MKTTSQIATTAGRVTGGSPQYVLNPEDVCRHDSAGPHTSHHQRATLEPYQNTDFHYSQPPIADNLNYSPCAAAMIARERFQVRHGPRATLPRRQIVSKEVRKALVAAEMARWQCY